MALGPQNSSWTFKLLKYSWPFLIMVIIVFTTNLLSAAHLQFHSETVTRSRASRRADDGDRTAKESVTRYIASSCMWPRRAISPLRVCAATTAGYATFESSLVITLVVRSKRRAGHTNLMNCSEAHLPWMLGSFASSSFL